MAIEFSDIKKLAAATGVGVTDAKKALEESKGDFEKAVATMREKGLAKAEKKGGREARAGLVDGYIHSDRIGVVVEVNCETDFVAKTDEFKTFVHDVAMHICASAPEFINVDDVPKKTIKAEEDIERKALIKAKKPAKVIDDILKGKIEKFYEQVCLLKQPFIKNPKITIEDYQNEIIAKLGENIVIRNMARIELGQN